MNKIQISASILSANFACLGQEIERALLAGVDWIHFDVMDNHFVPNLTFGPVVCQSLRQAGVKARIDVHLMVDNPEPYIESFAKAGANLISFHPETAHQVKDCLKKIKQLGIQAGLVLNPDRPLSLIKDYLKDIDLLLLMSVYPGFAGQVFIPDSLAKIQQARELIDHTGSNASLGVDGGIKQSNIASVVTAGADFCIIGSALFHAPDFNIYMREIREQIQVALQKP